ncbi:unnamed protein product [Anisakis simplex]|uniref:Uncharacterized protein n=1 Tax=Anisakis simplex TaxID=6269 RepID=A0A0M3K9F0_ANISI|nr:unnamed protein product [Anisakis simplex]
MTTAYSVHSNGCVHQLIKSNIDHSLANTTNKVSSNSSNFDTSINSPSSTITTAAALCKAPSDCGGSSSGLGGMTKTDIVSSDESSLARYVSFIMCSKLEERFIKLCNQLLFDVRCLYL